MRGNAEQPVSARPTARPDNTIKRPRWSYTPVMLKSSARPVSDEKMLLIRMRALYVQLDDAQSDSPEYERLRHGDSQTRHRIRHSRR